ncbi:MAG: hypothetical protein ABI852_00735 [Gemmatimonadaceae bacterium]
MFRFELLCALALPCSINACTDSSIVAPAAREVRYSGTVSQPAGGAFLVYKISGVWKVNDKNELISGVDTVNIIDASVYGQTGTARYVLKTLCASVVGKEAWAEQEVIETSSPLSAPVGSKGVVHFINVGGVARGAGGPKDALYPAGNLCADKPSGLPVFDMAGGIVVIP